MQRVTLSEYISFLFFFRYTRYFYPKPNGLITSSFVIVNVVLFCYRRSEHLGRLAALGIIGDARILKILSYHRQLRSTAPNVLQHKQTLWIAIIYMVHFCDHGMILSNTRFLFASWSWQFFVILCSQHCHFVFFL